jgi:hypothetical protein
LGTRRIEPLVLQGKQDAVPFTATLDGEAFKDFRVRTQITHGLEAASLAVPTVCIERNDRLA